MENKETLINGLIQSACKLTEDCKTAEDIRQRLRGLLVSEYKCDRNIKPEQAVRLADALSDVIIRKRGQQADETPTMKIYIARDAATFEDEDQERFVGRHPEKETEFGRLRLFYEKPEINNRTGVWEGARTACEIKTYMFPEIHCKECMEFTGPANIPEHLHYPGALHKIQ